MTGYSICVCTRNRPEGIRNLLASLNNLIVEQDAEVKVIVVENDTESRSEAAIASAARSMKFPLHYFLEPRPGLAHARNRSVAESGDTDFCCFVDDDQVVDANWLSEMIRCQREFDADGVWGTNPPLFSREVPDYIRKFHTPKPFGYGEIVTTAFTNSLMIRKSYLDQIDGPFDSRLNFCGGEDRFLTFNVTKLGGVIRCNQNARAFEVVPESRTTIRFAVNRTFRIANAGIFISTLEDASFRPVSAVPHLFARLCYGALILVPFFLFGKENKLRGLIKTVNAVGGLTAVFGRRNEFYK